MSSTGSASTGAATSSYDEVPYPSSSFPQTHPNRLAAMARLFGIPAAAPASARVLELGCSDGGNLIPMAARLPRAKFLGIDASSAQIATGRKVIAAGQLANVELRQQDIMDFSASEGRFDYIIAHGVYSWVPAPVREKILALVAAHLAPNGVAYVSYNALPGSAPRMMLRELAFFHTRGITDPAVKAQRVRDLLRALADPMSEIDKPHSALFQREFDYIDKAPEFCLRHDLLETENQAFYFHEFVAAAAKRRLQYVSETSLWEMLPATLGAKARAALEKCEHLLDMEQQLDFLRFRSFRQTLLCHAATPVRRQLTAKAVKEFAFQPRFRGPGEGVDLAPGVLVKFTRDDASHFRTAHPFVKAAFLALSETPGRAAGFTALANEAGRRLLPAARAPEEKTRDEVALMNDLMKLVSVGLIELHAEAVGPTGTAVPKKPRALSLTRYQAMASDRVTNCVHEAVALDLLPRHVIAACDGKRTIDGILEALLASVAAGNLSVANGNQPITDRGQLAEVLRPQVRRIVEDSIRLGLMA